MKRKFILAALLFAFAAQTRVSAASIKLDGQAVTIDFSDLQGTGFDIFRATGRLSSWETLAKNVDSKTFTDRNLGGRSPYEYYYFIRRGNDLLATLSLETELFGDKVRFYSPSDNQNDIRNEVNKIGKDMTPEQFGNGRYALFFKPGDYRSTGLLYVGFYTQVAGLGKYPKDCKTYTFLTPSPLVEWGLATDLGAWNAVNCTCTFWRSMENLAVMRADGEGYSEDVDKRFIWGVSQAAPLRRVYTNRMTEYDFLAGYASGGFTADCCFDEVAGSYSQQQWYTRNSHIQNGTGPFGPGGWNYAYQGVSFGNVNWADVSDNWDRDVQAGDEDHQWGNVSREEKTPVIREKPFIFLDNGRFKVFKPSLRRDATSMSWTDTNMGPGEVLDVVNDFYVAKPGVSAATINAQLRNGKHIIFTPGIYELEAPISVERVNTIILGLGYATLIPGQSNDDTAIKVADVDGVTIAGLLFDTKYSSKNLLRVGDYTSEVSHAANPTLLADLYFRVGGVYPYHVNVDQPLMIKSNDVIGDHFWIWRADHGEGTGWTGNTSKNGIVVYGDNVTIYGLFNEHFQEYQALWYGENGHLFFYQCETPYDPQRQSDYLSHVDAASGQSANGYAAYKVAKGVKNHYASMMGMYDVFIYTNGAPIEIRNSIEIPKGERNVKIHNACNVCISNLPNCGFRNVVGDYCESTLEWNSDGNAVSRRSQVVDFNGTMVKSPDWIQDEIVPDKDNIQTAVRSIDKTKDIDIALSGSGNIVLIETALTDYAVSVFNSNGSKVADFGAANSISLSRFAPGIYFVKVKPANGNAVTKKVVRK